MFDAGIQLHDDLGRRGRRRKKIPYAKQTKAQKAFGAVASACQKEMREGGMSRSEMRSCMVEGLRAKGFAAGGAKRKKRRRKSK